MGASAAPALFGEAPMNPSFLQPELSDRLHASGSLSNAACGARFSPDGRAVDVRACRVAAGGRPGREEGGRGAAANGEGRLAGAWHGSSSGDGGASHEQHGRTHA